MDTINNAFPLCEFSPLDNKDNLVEFIQRIFVKNKMLNLPDFKDFFKIKIKFF